MLLNVTEKRAVPAVDKDPQPLASTHELESEDDVELKAAEATPSKATSISILLTVTAPKASQQAIGTVPC